MSVGRFFSMIKFEHSVFALPFAYVGMVMGFKNGISWDVVALVTVAMVSARSAAMALNRIIDVDIDAKNERTANRELPSGKVGLREAWFFTGLSIVVFEVSAYLINPLAFRLSPVALFFMLTYSYTKRFTWLSHFYLGATDAIAPLGGYVAASDSLSLPIFLLAAFVMFWIAGFDILYSLQDRDFDRKEGLYSVPAVFGVRAALLVSALSHIIAFSLLMVFIYHFHLGLFAYLGAIVVGLLLIMEHKLVDPDDPKKINIAFFNINGYIGAVVLFSVIAGIYL